jgi:hypothetical protein
MSDSGYVSPIQIGDLAMVIRWPHEHGLKMLGGVITVQGFLDMVHCPLCNLLFEERSAVYMESLKAVPLSWLKRIPPLTELEGLESEEVERLPTQRMIEAAKRYKRLVMSK